MDSKKIPQHIAVIMDGNGRWAKKRFLPRIAGHKEGAESVRVVLRTCAELGVKYLTVYAFSTENWSRPKGEVSFLMGLFSRMIERELEELNKSGVKLQFLGRLNKFPADLRKKMNAAMELTAENKKITLSVLVNYGGRAEIVDAFRQMTNDKLSNEQISENSINNYLYTRDLPDPDLLIRTANEMRVSNFLLWQIAYAEIYITPTFWPDFRKKQLIEAVEAYQKRERRFGKVKG